METALPDLVIGNAFHNSVTLLLSDPINPGKFQSPLIYPTSLGVGGVAVADVNGDGVLDLIANEGYFFGELGRTLVEVFPGQRGSGAPTFGSPIQYSYNQGVPGPLQVGDFNRDGIADLAAYTNWEAVTILEGTPDYPRGLLPQAFVYPGSATSYPSNGGQLPVADLNSDGLPDLITAAGSVVVTLNSPAAPGFFQTPTIIGSGLFVATADFNGDGIPDIAYAGTGNLVTVLLSVASQPGTYQTAVTYAAGNGITALTAGDFNADGHPDLAVANGSDTTISVLINDPGHPGQFLPQGVYPVAASPIYLAAADMNGDGFADLIALDQAGNAEVLLSAVQSTVTLTNVAIAGSGYHDLQASFYPELSRSNPILGASNSNIVPLVLPGTPSVTLSATPATVALGNVAALTATITMVNGATEPVRGGSVVFFDGTRSLGSAQVIVKGSAAGTATLRTTSFGPGTHSITAQFSGTPRGSIPALGAASAPVSLTVTGLAASTTNLTVAPDPSNNANFAFQAVVAGSGPTPPTGTVNFVSTTAGTTLGSAPLSGPSSVAYGTALTSSVAVGSPDWVTADFNNDGILDIASISTVNTSMLAVTLGDPAHPGQFLPATNYALNQSGTGSFPLFTGAIIAADFNGDGVLDLAVGTIQPANPTAGNSLAIFFGDPANPGQFQSPQMIALGDLRSTVFRRLQWRRASRPCLS